MAATYKGPIEASVTRDEKGHRDYTLISLVNCLRTDGPNIVMNCAGLPVIGSTWSLDSDSDPWAFCWPTMKVQRAPSIKQGQPTTSFWVTQTFSTRPLIRCNDTPIEDPLLEPTKLSGSFVRYTREAKLDFNGDAITNSSFEPITGQENEWDANRPNVHVEFNQSTSGLSTFSQMVDTVNDSPLWGLPARCIKLSNVSWERKLFGVCSYYYTIGYDFDIDYNSFDRTLLDHGHKALNGVFTATGSGAVWTVTNFSDGTTPNPDNPNHYIRVLDVNGNPMEVILDGSGKPWDATDTGTGAAPPGTRFVQYYPQSNFLLLGIPTSL